MKVVLTGACGFIGSHILEEYQSQNYQILAVDKVFNNFPKSKNTCFILGDLNNDYVLEAIKLFRPQVINHHAAQIDVRKSLLDPILDLNENVGNSLRLLEVAKEVNAHFIFASSAGAINGSEFPASPYGIAKLTVEKYIDFYKNHHNLQATIWRYPNIYGPRQVGGVVGLFCKKALLDETLSINGGDQTRDFVYVKDIAKLNVEAIKFPNQNLTIASESQTSIKNLIDLLEKNLNKTIEKTYLAYVEGEVLESKLFLSPELKDYQFTSFEEGLRETLEYWKDFLQ